MLRFEFVGVLWCDHFFLSVISVVIFELSMISFASPRAARCFALSIAERWEILSSDANATASIVFGRSVFFISNLTVMRFMDLLLISCVT